MKRSRLFYLCVSLLAAFLVTACSRNTISFSRQEVIVNGLPAVCETVRTGSSEYYRLRDVAVLLSGTEAQFSVDWDAARNTVILTGGNEYLPNGSELAFAEHGKDANVVPSPQKFVVNGAERTFPDVYNVGGMNCLKLQDLADAFGFSLLCDADAGTVSIESPILPEPQTAPAFEIFFFDVNEGDAALVLCDREAMLIDGGDAMYSSLIYSALQHRNIEHLKYIVASHADADHVGGLSGALNAVSVDTALCTVSDWDGSAFSSFQKYLHLQGVDITVPSAGDVFPLGSASVEVLYPNAGESFSNNTSLVLKITYIDTSFLFVGDCGAADEDSLLQSGLCLESTLLKVGHHGSSGSTTSAFLNAVDPDYAVISVGSGNPYGHPADSVLERLQSSGAAVFRTDMHGEIHCVSDGELLTFEVSKNADADPFVRAEQEEITRSMPLWDTDDPALSDSLYVVNTNSRKFHLPDCPSVADIAEHNRLYTSESRDELIAQGYRPCKGCNP